ncbi:Secondary metabolism regulator LAE1 like protein [Verticillium longisporum]|nr:Secondary metabolism regulator LAE1 like protein [Verticillium longisporum]
MADEQEAVLEPEPTIEDSGIDEDSNESSTASLWSSILNFEKENGRTYHAFNRGKYLYPNDEQEKERLDVIHMLWNQTLEGRLALCPANASSTRVLDAGTGTGVWGIDYADLHPEAEVLGVDLSPIQPPFVPPNCTFMIDDLEHTWTWTKPFDFIFARGMIGSFREPQDFVKEAFKNLRPNGYLELQDNTFPLGCDDGTLQGTRLKEWTSHMITAADRAKRSISVANRFQQMMEDEGFVDIVVTRKKWPTNPWTRDKKYKELGAWALLGLQDDLDAISMALFTRELGWSSNETTVYLAEVRKDLQNRSIHAYWPVYIVYGRKPDDGLSVLNGQ